MTYKVNGEKINLDFVEAIDSVEYRSTAVKIIADSYIKDDCPAFLEDRTFLIGYFSTMTEIKVENDNDLIEISKTINTRKLPYFTEMKRAYHKRVKYIVSGKSIMVKAHNILSSVVKLLNEYSNPEKIIEEFGKLDSEHLEMAKPYLDSILSKFNNK